jgi:hypothetical protein
MTFISMAFFPFLIVECILKSINNHIQDGKLSCSSSQMDDEI